MNQNLPQPSTLLSSIAQYKQILRSYAGVPSPGALGTIPSKRQGTQLATQQIRKHNAYHRNTEQLRLEICSGIHAVQLPCSEQGYLQQVVHDHVQTAFEHIQGWRSYSHSEQPVPVSDHSPSCASWHTITVSKHRIIGSFGLEKTSKHIWFNL